MAVEGDESNTDNGNKDERDILPEKNPEPPILKEEMK